MRRDCIDARKLRYDAGYWADHSAVFHTPAAAPPPPPSSSYCFHRLVSTALDNFFFFFFKMPQSAILCGRRRLMVKVSRLRGRLRVFIFHTFATLAENYPSKNMHGLRRILKIFPLSWCGALRLHELTRISVCQQLRSKVRSRMRLLPLYNISCLAMGNHGIGETKWKSWEMLNWNRTVAIKYNWHTMYYRCAH